MGSLAIQALKLVTGTHGMDEVIGRMDSSKRSPERFLCQNIPAKHVSRRTDARLEVGRVSGQAANPMRRRFQGGKKTAADVAGSACDQNVGTRSRRMIGPHLSAPRPPALRLASRHLTDSSHGYGPISLPRPLSDLDPRSTTLQVADPILDPGRLGTESARTELSLSSSFWDFWYG